MVHHPSSRRRRRPCSELRDLAVTVNTADKPTIVLDELRAELSPETLITEPDVIAAHSQDHAVFCPVGEALGLVRAKSVEDVIATVRFASEHGIPVVTQGARSGLAGAANAIDGSILLNLSGMRSILEVDKVDMTCTVEPGVLVGDLKRHLQSFGLAYPPDPSSVEISTIGGNVTTTAGGLCCVKYGVTRDYVRNLRVVLADGNLLEVGRSTAKQSVGPDLSQLFIGSEGTLGVIVGITLDLVPSLPEVMTAVAFFGDDVSAAETVTQFMATGARPSSWSTWTGPSFQWSMPMRTSGSRRAPPRCF